MCELYFALHRATTQRLIQRSVTQHNSRSTVREVPIIDVDSNVWAAGDTVTFRINTGEADFRDGEDPEADKLEVTIIHTESNAILSENTFTP